MSGMRVQDTHNLLEIVRTVDNSGVEKNRELCIILTQKQLGGVDEIRGIFRSHSNMYDELFYKNSYRLLHVNYFRKKASP